MKRIAAPMIGGVITSSMLELLLYPVIYVLWRKHHLPHSSLNETGSNHTLPQWANLPNRSNDATGQTCSALRLATLHLYPIPFGWLHIQSALS
jgi:hypothetical protein